MKTAFVALLFFFCIPLISARAAPGESVVVDPKTGNYIVTYYGISDAGVRVLLTATLQPSTKIAPSVASNLEQDPKFKIHYEYDVKNARLAVQSINVLVVDQISSIISSAPITAAVDLANLDQARASVEAASASLTGPRNWQASAIAGTSVGIRVGWDSDDGIKPGNIARRFGFWSYDLPGLRSMQLQGDAEPWAFVDEGPTSDIAASVDQLESNDFVARPVAAPVIALPSPFSYSQVLALIGSETQSWIGKKFIDESLFYRVDRLLKAAQAAATAGNKTAVQELLKEVRLLLKRECDGNDLDQSVNKATSRHAPIDPLARAVLEFDLKYILSRLKADESATKG